MQKRGAIIEIGAVILVVITTIGAIAIFSESKDIYVGDSRNSTVYLYEHCKEKVNNIPQNDQVIFKNLEEAINTGYIPADGCT